MGEKERERIFLLLASLPKYLQWSARGKDEARSQEICASLLLPGWDPSPQTMSYCLPCSMNRDTQQQQSRQHPNWLRLLLSQQEAQPVAILHQTTPLLCLLKNQAPEISSKEQMCLFSVFFFFPCIAYFLSWGFLFLQYFPSCKTSQEPIASAYASYENYIFPVMATARNTCAMYLLQPR